MKTNKLLSRKKKLNRKKDKKTKRKRKSPRATYIKNIIVAGGGGSGGGGNSNSNTSQGGQGIGGTINLYPGAVFNDPYHNNGFNPAPEPRNLMPPPPPGSAINDYNVFLDPSAIRSLGSSTGLSSLTSNSTWDGTTKSFRSSLQSMSSSSRYSPGLSSLTSNSSWDETTKTSNSNKSKMDIAEAKSLLTSNKSNMDIAEAKSLLSGSRSSMDIPEAKSLSSRESMSIVSPHTATPKSSPFSVDSTRENTPYYFTTVPLSPGEMYLDSPATLPQLPANINQEDDEEIAGFLRKWRNQNNNPGFDKWRRKHSPNNNVDAVSIQDGYDEDAVSIQDGYEPLLIKKDIDAVSIQDSYDKKPLLIKNDVDAVSIQDSYDKKPLLIKNDVDAVSIQDGYENNTQMVNYKPRDVYKRLFSDLSVGSYRTPLKIDSYDRINLGNSSQLHTSGSSFSPNIPLQDEYSAALQLRDTKSFDVPANSLSSNMTGNFSTAQLETQKEEHKNKKNKIELDDRNVSGSKNDDEETKEETTMKNRIKPIKSKKKNK